MTNLGGAPTYPGAHRGQPQPPQAASQQGISAARVRRRSGSTAPKPEGPRPSPGMGIEVFVQQRRSGCGTLLVALLALAIITAIVIFLGAFGLLGWIFS